ncbi:Hypothetical protein SMAX5B_016804 [Scophthalmus maximus]|uniref:Uncharacterized protein n=1 Tax=Scophthalmus maximus TaxID=52904 RepID=A0A2U9CDZ3_SCOMX|nr:Hypothetical protein SMAX5B_016804 [Scophthalmus maximus]
MQLSEPPFMTLHHTSHILYSQFDRLCAPSVGQDASERAKDSPRLQRTNVCALQRRRDWTENCRRPAVNLEKRRGCKVTLPHSEPACGQGSRCPSDTCVKLWRAQADGVFPTLPSNATMEQYVTHNTKDVTTYPTGVGPRVDLLHVPPEG